MNDARSLMLSPALLLRMTELRDSDSSSFFIIGHQDNIISPNARFVGRGA